jgi:hypothetical protein
MISRAFFSRSISIYLLSCWQPVRSPIVASISEESLKRWNRLGIGRIEMALGCSAGAEPAPAEQLRRVAGLPVVVARERGEQDSRGR